MDYPKSMNYACILLLSLAIITPTFIYGQVGPVIWEDDFNTLNTDVWTPDVGDGCPNLCGWGNQELQYYSPNNVSIEPIPSEPGNFALVLEAKRETQGGRGFTSGKVLTEGKLSVHYGLIEIRMMVPNLETGLWPAAWLLGTANLNWPDKGEIDMMEMGHASAERTRQGFPNSSVNNYVGSNAIFATPGGPGSISFDVDYNQPYISNTPMNDRFITYRLYWDPSSLRFTVVDGGTEYDLYTGPLPIDPEGVTSAFTKPFYLLLNMAVGGNFTDALNDGQVTAPLPAKMYVDHVRISQWNGHGSVEYNYNDSQPESGVFGVFTDNTPTNNQLDLGSDGEIYGWGGTVQEGNTPPFEGANVIAWQNTTPNSWFGGGITALFGKNMSNYVASGSLKFKIKIPGNVSFRIGITDNFTNESYVTFPAGETTYGLARNGAWGTVEIPLTDFAGLIAFQEINYLFTIASVDGAFPTERFQFAIDDIIWDDGGQDGPIASTIQVTPSTATINVGQTQQFIAQVYDQNGNSMDASLSWSATGGSISNDGLYTGIAEGTFTVTATSGSINQSVTVTVNALANDCNGGPSNGDYTYTISGGDTPSLTFQPGYAGVGSNVAILYYGTSPNGTYPGYYVTPNAPYVLSNVGAGQTVYFYYTYNVPEGGERNTSADRHSFTVGSCGNGARIAQKTKKSSEKVSKILSATHVSIFPNPTLNLLNIEGPGSLRRVVLVDLSGRQVLNIPLAGENATQIRLKSLQTGNYLMMIVTDEGVYERRILKK